MSTAVLLRGLVLTLHLQLPANGQDLEVVADSTRVTVGDPLELEVRVSLGEVGSLVDRLPAPRDSAPEGFRILGVEPLAAAEGGGLRARMRVAFFRPGSTNVPALALPYRPAPGAPIDTLVSRPIPVQVVGVLPPGDQPLRDIKELIPLGPESRLPIVLVLLAAALVAAYAIARRLRRKRRVIEAPTLPPREGRSAYEVALERLADVERAALPERGQVTRHYVLITGVLREYLEQAAGVRALELTTSELVWSLPPALSEAGLRETCGELLGEADLVKFARLRPGPDEAKLFLSRAHSLLQHWHAGLLASAEAWSGSAAGPGDSGDGGDIGGAELPTSTMRA